MKLSILIILLSLSSTFASDTTRYTILTTERIMGKQLMWSDGPGKISYSYEYNDRGRGPKIRVDLILENDMVISRRASGVDYFKGSVLETFEVSNGVAKWKNKIEDDQRNVSGVVLYSPMDGIPGEIEWSLKVLLKQHHHVDEMGVLPAGKVRTVHVKSHTARVNSFPEELELYSFTGSGGPPTYVWFTPKKEYFGTITGWMSTIKLGYEFLVPELKRLQDEIEEDYFIGQAIGLTQKSTTPVAIVNVSVFDSRTGKVLPDRTVIIDQGKIKEIGKVKSVSVPENSKIISGKGKMLLPGLWDNHSHYNITQGLYHLAAGVTNIKDLANSCSVRRFPSGQVSLIYRKNCKDP